MKLKIELSGKGKKLRFINLEANILAELNRVSDKLYSLNAELNNYFSERSAVMPEEMQTQIESLIDNVDDTYLENSVRPICKRAIIDGLTVEEFEKEFDELCADYGVVNSQTLTETALKIFELEHSVFEKL